MADLPNIVVTIARQLGAGGAILGQRVATRLGYTYLDRDILRMAAEKAGVSPEHLQHWDERCSRVWERLVDSFAVGPPEGIYSSVITMPTIRDERLFEMESRVIRDLAARHNLVVIGRGAFWIMREHPALVRVFLHSPPEARIASVMAAFNLKSETEARTMIDQIDRERERFVQKMTGRSLTDSRNFDLAVNTQTVGMDAAEDLVARLVDEVRGKLGLKA